MVTYCTGTIKQEHLLFPKSTTNKIMRWGIGRGGGEGAGERGGGGGGGGGR